MSEPASKRPTALIAIKELVAGRRYRQSEELAVQGQLREARFADRRLDDDRYATPSPDGR
ncbi:hypothetical protein ACE15N_21940 (plasmid) [Xanthomonas campestris pv. passiflorae]